MCPCHVLKRRRISSEQNHPPQGGQSFRSQTRCLSCLSITNLFPHSKVRLSLYLGFVTSVVLFANAILFDLYILLLMQTQPIRRNVNARRPCSYRRTFFIQCMYTMHSRWMKRLFEANVTLNDFFFQRRKFLSICKYECAPITQYCWYFYKFSLFILSRLSGFWQNSCWT